MSILYPYTPQLFCSFASYSYYADVGLNNVRVARLWIIYSSFYTYNNMLQMLSLPLICDGSMILHQQVHVKQLQLFIGFSWRALGQIVL